MVFVESFATKAQRMVFGCLFALAIGLAVPEARSEHPASPSTDASPTPLPTPKSTPGEDEEEEAEIRRNHRFMGQPIISSNARLVVGTEILVPTQYAAPQIIPQSHGGSVLQPSMPVAFEKRQVGVSVDQRGWKISELEGFLDYGNPVRIVVPVFNDKGEWVGSTFQEHPNPILQPVFGTFQRH